MSTTTPNFGWQVPTSTDYVKDGAVAIETLGDAIDASLADLKGGTTGQVLSKNTNADMDFTWINNDVGDITAVTAGTGLSGGGTSGDVTLNLANTAVAAGTYGSTTQSPVITVDAQGRITSASNATIVGGGMTLIATATPSAATAVSFTSIPTTYKQLIIIWQNVFQSSSSTTWGLRLNNDAGGNWDGVEFYQSTTNASFTGVNYGGGTMIDPAIGYTGTSSTAYNWMSYGVCEIWNANDGAGRKLVEMRAVSNNGNSNFVYNQHHWLGTYNSSAAISRLDFIRSATQTITGTFRLYGVN